MSSSGQPPSVPLSADNGGHVAMPVAAAAGVEGPHAVHGVHSVRLDAKASHQVRLGCSDLLAIADSCAQQLANPRWWGMCSAGRDSRLAEASVRNEGPKSGGRVCVITRGGGEGVVCVQPPQSEPAAGGLGAPSPYEAPGSHGAIFWPQVDPRNDGKARRDDQFR